MKLKAVSNVTCLVLITAMLASCADDDDIGETENRPTKGEYAVVAGGALFGLAGGLVAAGVVAGMEHDRKEHPEAYGDYSNGTVYLHQPPTETKNTPRLTAKKAPPPSKTTSTAAPPQKITRGKNGKTYTDSNGTEYLVR